MVNVTMTDDADDEDKEARAVRILREARDNVRRLKREERERRDELEKLPAAEVAKRLIGAPEDPVARWRREADEATAARAAAKAEIASKPAPAPFDWSAFDDRIQAAIEAERLLMCETVGTAVGELLNEERVIVMREVRDELTSLKLECAKLATEAATLREALAVDRARVVDMPSPLSRRVN